MTLTTGKRATGKYDVQTVGDYPIIVGFITGGKQVWLAERGAIQLGYYRTKRQAVEAIELQITQEVTT